MECMRLYSLGCVPMYLGTCSLGVCLPMYLGTCRHASESYIHYETRHGTGTWVCSHSCVFSRYHEPRALWNPEEHIRGDMLTTYVHTHDGDLTHAITLKRVP